jgi:hypothetical protein
MAENDRLDEVTGKSKISMLRLTGYIILGVSCILFIMIPVVPFLGFSTVKIAGITTGLIIAGEILFYLSLAILGRSFYDKIKSKFRFRKAKTNDRKSTDSNPE